jgi:hypothetical protein
MKLRDQQRDGAPADLQQCQLSARRHAPPP